MKGEKERERGRERRCTEQMRKGGRWRRRRGASSGWRAWRWREEGGGYMFFVFLSLVLVELEL